MFPPIYVISAKDKNNKYGRKFNNCAHNSKTSVCHTICVISPLTLLQGPVQSYDCEKYCSKANNFLLMRYILLTQVIIFGTI